MKNARRLLSRSELWGAFLGDQQRAPCAVRSVACRLSRFDPTLVLSSREGAPGRLASPAAWGVWGSQKTLIYSSAFPPGRTFAFVLAPKFPPSLLAPPHKILSSYLIFSCLLPPSTLGNKTTSLTKKPCASF